MNKKLSMNKKTFLTYIFIHFEHLHTYKSFFVHIYIIATYTYTSHMNKKIKLIKIKKHIATYEQKHIATYIHIYIIYIYDQKTIN